MHAPIIRSAYRQTKASWLWGVFVALLACFVGLCVSAQCAYADEAAPGGRGLAVTGGIEGVDWTYGGGVLKIKSSLTSPITVTMAEGVDTTTDRIVVWNDYTELEDVERMKPVVLAGVNINVGTARQPALGVGGSATSPVEIAPKTENVLIGGVDTPAIVSVLESGGYGDLTIRAQEQGFLERLFAPAEAGSLYLGAGVVSDGGGDMAVDASVEFLAGGADYLRVTARATGDHPAFNDVVYIEEGCQTCFDLGGDAGLGFWVQGNDEIEGGDSLARIRGGYFAQGEAGTALNLDKGSLGRVANLNILAKDPRMRVVPSATACDDAGVAERYPYAVVADPGAFEVEGEGEWTYDIASETLTITSAPKGGNLTVSPAAWVPSEKMQSARIHIDAGEGNDAYVTINGVHLDNGYTRSKSSFEVVSGAAHITVEGKNVLKAFPNEHNRSAAAALQSNTNALFLDGTGELNVSAKGGAGIGSAAGKPVGDITIGGSVTVNATSLQSYWWSNAGAAIGGGAHTIHATNGSVGRIFIGGDAAVHVKSGHEYDHDSGEYGAGIGAGRGFGYSGTVVIAGGHLTFDTDTPFSCNNVVLQGGVFDCAVSGDGKIHGKLPASGYKAVERTLDEGYRSQVVPENFEQGSLSLIDAQTYVYGSEIIPRNAQGYIKGSTPSGTLAVASYATKTGVDADGNPTFSEYQDGVPSDAGTYRVKITLPYAVSFGRIYTGIWKTVDITIEQRPLRGLVWHDTENRFENDGLRAWAEPQGVLEGDDVSVWVEEYPSPSNKNITFYASGLLGEDAGNYRFADGEALEFSAPLDPPPYGIDLTLLNHEGAETNGYTYGDTVYVSARLENPEPGTMSMYYRGDYRGELLDGPVAVDENGACTLSYDTARKIIKPTDPDTLGQDWREIVVTFTPEGEDASKYSRYDSFMLNRREVDICIESVDDRVFNGTNGDWSCSNLVWGLDGVLPEDEGKVSYTLGKGPYKYSWRRGNVGSTTIHARSSYDRIEGELVEFYKLKANSHNPDDEGLDYFEFRDFTPKNGAKVVQGEMGAPPAPVVTEILGDSITVQNHRAPSQITYDINGVEYGIREPGGQWRWEYVVNDWKVETVTFDNLAGGTIYEIGMRYVINGNWYYGDNPISSTMCCTTGGKGENYFKFDPPTADDYAIDYAAETMAFDEAYFEMNTAEDFSGTSMRPGTLTELLDGMEPGDQVSLYLRAAAFGNKNASDPLEVVLSARAAAPAVKAVDESADGADDGKVTGLSADIAYEYSADDGTTWTPVEAGATEVGGLAPGAYLVRVSATDSAFASEAAQLTVNAGTEPTYRLDIVNPSIAFDALAYGYPTQEGVVVSVSNPGNSPVEVTGANVTNESFVLTWLDTAETTVPGGKTQALFVIRPADGLGVGEYETSIRIEYKAGGASGSVAGKATFEVMRAAQDAPAGLFATAVGEAAIEAGAASVGGFGALEYGISTQEGQKPEKWQEETLFEGLAAATRYYVFARYGGDENHEPSAAASVEVWTPAAAPGKNEGFEIDYRGETASAHEGFEVSSDGATWGAGPVDVEPAGTLWVRVAATEGGAPASGATENVLPERPQEPIVLAKGETVVGAHDGKLVELDSSVAYEYMADGGAAWIPIPLGSIEVGGLAPGAYLVREAATDSAFASKATRVPVADGAGVVYDVSLSYRAFGAEYGYGVVDDKDVIATNKGNTAVEITGIALTGEHPDAFELVGFDGPVTLPAAQGEFPNPVTPSTATLCAVKPCSGLDAGFYLASVEITYTAGTEVKKTHGRVGFKVNKTDQAAPVSLSVKEMGASSTAPASMHVVLELLDGFAGFGAAEYGVSYKDDEASVVWNGANPVFDSLGSATHYYFWARYAGDANHNASAAVRIEAWTPYPAPGASEGYGIDYAAEKIEPWGEQGYEVSVDGSTWLSDGLADIEPGATFWVRRAEKDGIPHSAAREHTAPGRPAAPRLSAVAESAEGAADGTIEGLLPQLAYEYSADEGATWNKVVEGAQAIEGLAPGTYRVRLAATDSAFASEAAEATIAKGQAATCILSIAPIVFDDLEEGYAQTSALPVLASNDGNSDAVITGIEISGDQSESFVLDVQSNVKVPAGSEVQVAAISPAPGLAAGTYQAVVRVAYGEGAIAEAPVTLTVGEESVPRPDPDDPDRPDDPGPAVPGDASDRPASGSGGPDQLLAKTGDFTMTGAFVAGAVGVAALMAGAIALRRGSRL